MPQNSQNKLKHTEFWTYKTVFLADQISKFTRSIARETADLNLSQWRVLAAVAEKPGGSAADIASITPMDKTIVSRAVHSLITLGLIERSTDTRDKRCTTLHTTKNGNAVYENIAIKITTALQPSITKDAKTEQFLDLLNDFIERMDNTK